MVNTTRNHASPTPRTAPFQGAMPEPQVRAAECRWVKEQSGRQAVPEIADLTLWPTHAVVS